MLLLVGWWHLMFLILAIDLFIQFLMFSYKLTAPPLNYIRRYLPNLGTIDISPVVLILVLLFLRNLVFEMFAPSLF